MIHDSFCKINEFHASFVLLEKLLMTYKGQNQPDVFQLQSDFGIAWPVIHEHLNSLSKATYKLPNWVKKDCIFATQALEQSTSEKVAAFHSTFAKNKNILSITGGLGADEAAFAQNNKQITSLDPDACLNALAKYNFQKLGIDNIQRQTSTAEAFFATSNKTFDFLFADPDRRPEGKKLGGDIAKFTPDILALLEQKPNIAKEWLIKLSPLTDIQWIFNHFPQNTDVYVVESDGEVKEVLVHLHPDASRKIELVVLNNETFRWKGEMLQADLGDKDYFYVANPGTIKCGFHKNISQQSHISYVSSNHIYLRGKALLPEHVARKFEIIYTLTGSVNEMKKQLDQLGITKANIATRDFVLKTEDARQKLKIADGGEIYIFLTGKTDKCGFVCRKA